MMMPRGRAPRLLNPVDKLTFVVRLARIEYEAQCSCRLGAVAFDIGKRFSPVDMGFALTEKIEVRPVEKQHGLGHGFQS